MSAVEVSAVNVLRPSSPTGFNVFYDEELIFPITLYKFFTLAPMRLQ